MSQHDSTTIRKPWTDDRSLLDIQYGSWGYTALLVAHDLKLFPLLAEKPRTLVEVCEALRIARRPAEALLTLCVSMGLAYVQDGRYALTALAEDYLLESSPTYAGGVLDLDIASPLSFADLKKAVLTDVPQWYGGDWVKTIEEQAELARTFTHAMHSSSMGPALAWPEVLDLSEYQLLLDIGDARRGGVHGH